MCTIDFSKAFDEVNHYALYIKLMKRQLLDMIIALFSNCSTCIKWDNIFSEVFEISFGVNRCETRFRPLAYFVCSLY